MEKAHRVFRDEAYCATCYAREFKRKACARCGRPSRLPRRLEGVVCTACERERPCVRCERTGRPIAKISESGPVCVGCVRYFTVEQDPAFTSSARPETGPTKERKPLGTCSSCRRHRRLSGDDAEMQICNGCAEGGIVACPQCGGTMPAGYGKRCSPCYWRGLLHKRAEQNRFLFTNDVWKAVFEEYVNWIGERYDPKVTALRINEDAGFLADVASLGSDIPRPSAFIEAFPPAILRRHLVVSAFLAEEFGLRVSDQEKSDAVERNRIKALIAHSSSRSSAERALHDFHADLMRSCDEGKVKPRTVRLYMQAAVGLVKLGLKSERDVIDSAMLRRYLRQRPGQRASLFRFAKYLGLRLASDPHPTLEASVRKRAKAVLRALASKETLDLADRMSWNTAALEVYHSMSEIEAQEVLRNATLSEDGIIVRIESKGNRYVIPHHSRR